MNHFISKLFGLYTPFLICLRAATVSESECVVQVQLLSNRMIKINNEEELCRCLDFERPVSTMKLRNIEPCHITTSQVEGNMAISAESFCGCAGYEPHTIQKIIPTQPTFHDRDDNLDEESTLRISTEPNYDQRDESTLATDKTAVTESENENLVATESTINTDKKLNEEQENDKEEKSKNETMILENIHVETGVKDKATAVNVTSINNLHNRSELYSIDSTANNKTGFDYHQEDIPIATSITFSEDVLKKTSTNNQTKGVNKPENFDSSTLSTDKIDFSNGFDVKFIKNNTITMNKANKISLNNSSESHYVDSPTNITTEFDYHKESISIQTSMTFSEHDLNKTTTTYQTKQVYQPEHMNTSTATTDKIDIKSDIDTKFEKNKITTLNDSSKHGISSLEDVFVNKSNQASTVGSILLSDTEQVMNNSDTTEYLFWNKTANYNNDSLSNATLKNSVHNTNLISNETTDNYNIINNSVATTFNNSFVSNLGRDDSSLNYTADADLNQLENENIRRDPSLENTIHSTTDEEESKFNTSHPLHDTTFYDNSTDLRNFNEDYSEEGSGWISTENKKDSSDDTMNHNNVYDPFQYEKDTLITTNKDTLDYEYHSGDKEADVLTQLSTIKPKISDDIRETGENSMLQDPYSVIKAAIIILIILLLTIICGVFTIIILYGWFFKRGSYSLVRQEGNIEMEYSYRKRQT